MGFRHGAYAKIWTITDMTNGGTVLGRNMPAGKYALANVSISHKNKETGEYVTDFSDRFVRLLGKAYETSKSLNLPVDGEYDKKIHRPLNIQITSCDVTNKYYAPTKTLYTNCVIWEFSTDTNRDKTNNSPTNNNSSPTKKSNKTSNKNPEVDMSEFDEDDLPW